MTKNQEQISSLYQNLLDRLAIVRKRYHRISLLNGAFVTSFIALILLIDVVLLERASSFGIVGRTILFTLTLGGIAACAAWFIGRPMLMMFGFLPSKKNDELAGAVGAHFPHIHDRLLNAIQVYEAKEQRTALYSPALIDASFSDLYTAIESLDFSRAVDMEPLRKMRKLSAYAAAVFAVVFILSPSGFLGSLHRIINFNQAFAEPAPIVFFVEPGNAEVVRGTTVPLTIRTVGAPVAKINLRTRQHGQAQFDVRELIAAGGENVFRDSIPAIKSSTEYFLTAHDVESEKYTIKVVDRPLIRSFQIRLQYPMYTRLPAKTLEENVGDVAAYPGTIVSFNVTSSKELASASLTFSDKTVMAMKIDGVAAESHLRLMTERSYHLALEDKEHLSNPDPIEYQLKLLPDAFPTVSVLVPGKNVDVTESMQLDLLLRITDDFGFSKLRLAYRLAHSRYERPSEEFSFADVRLPSSTQTAQEIWHYWNFAGLHLVPEDVVAYYVEVFDNDNVSGPKSARSETYLVRLPSLDEVFRDVAQSQSHSLESLQSAQKDLQQMRKDMEEMEKELRKDPQKSDWQQQKKGEELSKRFDEMKQKIDETARKMDEMVKQMEQNKLLSPETLEKYLELQKLMEELNTPELQQALKKMQEAMKQATPEQIKEAMKNMQMTEEFLRKSLERTIELLKRIAIEQKLDELIKRTEQLQQQQEDLRQQTSQTNPSDEQKREELAKQQADLQKQLDALQKEVADLQKKMEEFPKDMPLEEMNAAQEGLQKDKVSEQMQEAAQQMQSGKMQSAQSGQQKANEGLEKFRQKLKAAQQLLQENQQRQAMNQMRKAMQNTLELSQRQEECKLNTQGLDPNSQRLREGAQQQSEIQEDLTRIANELAELSRKTFAVSPEMGRELGKAMQQMGQALQSLEQRNSGGAAQQQSEAMGSLNRAAMMMQGAMQSMMQGEGMGMAGLMQQLGKMSGAQMGINAQSQSMFGEGQGMSAQQQAEWGRLAGQQGAVRKSLEDLAREAEQSGELSKLLGDLTKTAQEMLEVQTDMEQGSVNSETLHKQDRIVSRLLDSQRSMRERDFEKRRRAESGTNIARTGPTDLDPNAQEGRSKLRQELLKVLEQKYAKDYEDLIRRYFEALEKMELQR